jgi:hypothetical protein
MPGRTGSVRDIEGISTLGWGYGSEHVPQFFDVRQLDCGGSSRFAQGVSLQGADLVIFRIDQKLN